MMTNFFWQKLEQLVNESELVIDRPKGSSHPDYTDTTYPLDYGYLAGTTTTDGGGIDAWVGTMPDNPPQIVGALATVDLVKRDSEIKVLLNCTPDDIATIITFKQEHNMGFYVIERVPNAISATD